MGRIVRLLQVLGVNSVPAFGVFAAAWTASSALALYWCESVLVTLLVGLRLWLHRRATGKRGHWEAPLLSETGRAREGGSFLGEFLSTALIFTAGHGVMLALVLFLLLPKQFPEAGGVDPGALLRGVGVISVLLALGFLYDAIGLDSRSFAWVKRLSKRLLGRVIVVHLTIIFGMMAMQWLEGPRGLFLVFAGFKTLSDLSAMTGGGRPASREPPGCLMAPIRALAGEKKAESFAHHYRTQQSFERGVAARSAARWEERREA